MEGSKTWLGGRSTESRTWLLMVVGLLLPLKSWSQTHRDIADSSLHAVHMDFSFGALVPQGNLSERFGTGGEVGIGAHVKTRSNWYLGVSSRFGFGASVSQPGLLSNLLTPAGELIDNEGQVALVTITGRSGRISADLGYLFPSRGMRSNANSGWLFKVGVGSFHHRIHFENTENIIAQLEEPYLAGYDRLTWGWSIEPFIGYWYMSPAKRVNWFAGFSALGAKTWPQRPMNFDTGLVEVEPRFDAGLGFTAGWVLHMYHRAPVTFWN
jgi:hypothetical protein